MPICCEPDERYPIVLDGDKGKEPEPIFWCRHLSARQFAATLKVGERAAAEPDADRRLDLLEEALGWSVIECRHVLRDIVSGRLLDVLTLREAWELWDKILHANRLLSDDAKKSDSPSPSDGASTAAAGGPEDAATAPARLSH